VDNRVDQLDAAAAGAEELLAELDLSDELDLFDEDLSDELDLSDEPDESDEEEDSVLPEVLLGTELFADSRLSVR
jgi:hypothetical protein